MIAVDHARGWSLRAAWRGAAKHVMAAYAIGATFGIVMHTPVGLTAGAAAFVAVVIGAARAISR